MVIFGESLVGYFEPLQLRDVLLGRVVERELPFVTQSHDGHRREALGHGCDAEHRARIHRLLRGDVAQARHAHVHDPVVQDDCPRGAGNVLALRELPHDAVHRGKDGAELRLASGVGEAALLGGQQGGQRDEECGNVAEVHWSLAGDGGTWREMGRPG